MKRKMIKKSIATLASAAMMATLAGAYAMPTSAINISSIKGSAFQYTMTTKKISNTKFSLTLSVLNNPGIQSLAFIIQNDSGVKCVKGYENNKPDGATVNVGRSDKQVFCDFVAPIDPSLPRDEIMTYDKLSFTFEYEVLSGSALDHKLQAGIVTYKSPNEPKAEVSFNVESDDPVPSDATIQISPSQNVRLGDVDCDGTIDTTDIFYLSQMVLEAPNGKLSTTYLDQQLKNKNSSWYKEYSFMKCAAVADIDHNAYIESKDKDSLMRYVAEKGAGATITNKEINTLFPVTVIYDN